MEDSYLDVYARTNISLGSRRTLSIFTAVDSAAYEQVGCVVTVNGTATTVTMKQYNTPLRQLYLMHWFGFSFFSDALLYTSEAVPVARGSVVTLQPYWVTPDGSTVFGAEQSVTVR